MSEVILHSSEEIQRRTRDWGKLAVADCSMGGEVASAVRPGVENTEGSGGGFSLDVEPTVKVEEKPRL